MFLGLLGGAVLTGLNAAGAIPVLFLRKVSQRGLDVGLGFAAGVMLAASFTSLIVPAIAMGAAIPVLIGIGMGALLVTLGDRFIPHLHFVRGHEGPLGVRLKAIWLFVLAVTVHNMPEGLAVGVGFGSGDLAAAGVLMLAIGIQNVPEGLSIGFSLQATGAYTRVRSYLVSVGSGLVEVPMSLLGAWATVTMKAILPYGMGLAAGAMIFVVSDEIVPEVHRLGRERLASYGLVTGLMVMLALDVMLG